MSYSVSDIAKLVDAEFLQRGKDMLIDNIITDSRKLLFPASSVFFALRGPRRNGNDFITELYNKEVRIFITDQDFNEQQLSAYPQATFLKVVDVLQSLQQLASFHRSQFDFPVIGITGSNGKTIIKEWLFQLLQQDYDIVRSPKSYNSQLGVPLSIWQIQKNHNLGIFEAGISEKQEMECLEKMIKPDIGVLAYLGDAHAEGFDSFEEKIKEKLKLFVDSKTLVYCSENAIVEKCVKQFANTVNKKIKLISWSRTSAADLMVNLIEKQISSTHIQCSFGHLSFGFFIPFTDEASVFNSITCCAVVLSLREDISSLITSMNGLQSVAMRLELIPGVNQCAVINDSYSADTDSLNIALDFLAQQQFYPKKTVIISDFMHSSADKSILYKKIADVITHKKVNRLIGIGDEISAFAHEFKIDEKLFYPSTQEFIKSMNSLTFSNEVILLKGARAFGFEKISGILEQKIHDTVLEINLNALRNNLKAYRNMLAPKTAIMAMVKAFGYGSGSMEIANLLQNEGVDYLSVAYTDEGVDLRKGGLRLPIMVMNTSVAGFDNIIRYQLEPQIYSISILKAFSNYLKQKNINQYPIHIKLDTGMHRLGFMQKDLNELLPLLKNQSPFVIKSVLSHLVASENPEHDAFTMEQGRQFLLMTDQIEKTVNYKFICHLSNTSAIQRHPQLQFDMVRLGIGLYGIDEFLSLQNVTTLKTTIAQIKAISAGETVGYGRKGVLKKNSSIATVRIGYADGYPRIFGNGNGKMLVNGIMVPVIGNVCMDMTMLDITGIDAKEGDEVIVFGSALSVKQLAVWANTIPYEILTSVSQRVKRVYYEE